MTQTGGSSGNIYFPPSQTQSAKNWAEHLDWMEGLEPVASPPSTASIWPGLALAGAITAFSLWLGSAPIWPFSLENGVHPFDAALLAMIFGMIIGNLRPNWGFLRPGMRFGAKKLLALGIVLLGVRLDFGEMIGVGAMGIAASAGCVVATLALCYFIAPAFGISRRFGFLLGTGTAICGGSAIVAMAPVIRADEEEVVLGVASVTLVGFAAMLILPLLAAAMQLSQQVFGAWVGLSIHQVPQVVAAGFSYGTTSGEFATVIKLTRVCLLAPVVVCASLLMARRMHNKSGISIQMTLKAIPLFVIGFIAMAAIQSLGLLPEVEFTWPTRSETDSGLVVSLSALAASGASFFLALGMAGVGWETRLFALAKAGTRPLLTTLIVSSILAIVTLGLSLAIFSN